MEFLLSIAGVVSILIFVFWVVAIPFIYPKYLANFITDLIPKTYLFLFWNFFLTHFIMGILLILTGHSSFGLILISFLTLAYGLIQYLKSKKVLVNGIFSFVLDIAYGSIHQIVFYLFITGLLSYSIYLFYYQSIIFGSIISYCVAFYLISTWLGLRWYSQKKDKSKFNFTNQLNYTKSHSGHLSLKQVLDDFEPDISKHFYQLTTGIDNLLSVLTEFVYADFIPEKLRTGDAEQIILSLTDYVLTVNSIPDDEKAIIQNLIEKRKDIYDWKNNFNISVHIQSNKLSNNKKEVIKKVSSKGKKATNKPPKSAGK